MTVSAVRQGSPGRPRSAAAHRAILDAVTAMIGEGETLSRLSMDAVAARAGVSKATIYRRWPNKEAMVLDALGADIPAPPPLPGRSMREDLTLILHALAHTPQSTLPKIFHPRCHAMLLVEQAHDPEFMRRYRLECIEPRRQRLIGVLRRGAETGELRADIDVEMLHDILVSPLFLRLISMPPGEDLPAGFIDELLDATLNGIAPR